MKKKLSKYSGNIILDNKKIIDAIKVINNVKLKTLIVIDKNRKLIGTLTDGDIRRAMLKGLNTNNSITPIVNKKPIKKKLGKKISNYKDAKIIPIVDSRNKVVNLEEKKRDKLNLNMQADLDIVLMAGGYGKRLLPLTNKVPKPLLKINKKSILELAIENFEKYNFKNFYISTHYKSSLIKKYFNSKKFLKFKIVYLVEKKPLGTAGCLSILNFDRIKENILVYNGDIITNLNILNLYKFHIDTESDITVCAKEYSNSSPYGEILFDGFKIKKILEKPQKKSFVNAGIYILKKKLIKKVKTSRIDMTDVIEQTINKKGKVNIYPIYEYWADMGTKQNYKQILKQKGF